MSRWANLVTAVFAASLHCRTCLHCWCLLTVLFVSCMLRVWGGDLRQSRGPDRICQTSAMVESPLREKLWPCSREVLGGHPDSHRRTQWMVRCDAFKCCSSTLGCCLYVDNNKVLKDSELVWCHIWYIPQNYFVIYFSLPLCMLCPYLYFQILYLECHTKCCCADVKYS